MRGIERAAAAFTLLCALLSIPVSAGYASDESGTAIPPAYIDSITVTSEDMGTMEDLPPEDPEIQIEFGPYEDIHTGGNLDFGSLLEQLLALFGGDLPGLFSEDSLTPEGNMSLIDDVLQGDKLDGKEFLTVQSRNGNYFYLVVDRSTGKDNVHFLNQVDESDLLALMEDGGEEVKPPPVCSCKDRCYVGHVDTACEICAVNISKCAGKETPKPTAAPTPETDASAGNQVLKMAGGIVGLLLIAGMIGGVLFYFLRGRGKAIPADKDSSAPEPEGEYAEFELSDEEGPDLPEA